MLSLGRKPQEPEIRKMSSPRRGRQICDVVHTARITAKYLSPLRGFFSFLSLSWGSRPRLSICRRSAARKRMTTFHYDSTSLLHSARLMAFGYFLK